MTPLQLKDSYNLVGARTWESKDFLVDNLKSSRSLFTEESLENRSPRPISVDVYALLSGLPLPENLISYIYEIQSRLKLLLGRKLYYFVLPQNLGLEYCVFKWPDSPWNDEWLKEIIPVVRDSAGSAPKLNFSSFQINPDGCVVLKGFDLNGMFFATRERVLSALPFLPKKQSQWAHVPIARILEPVGAEKFQKLKDFQQSFVGENEVNLECIKLVREHRWYMTERTIIQQDFFNAK